MAFFAVDDPWERIPDRRRTDRVDALLAVAFVLLAALGVEILRSLDALSDSAHQGVLPYVAILTGTLPLAVRRRWPLAVMAWMALHMFVVGVTIPQVMGSPTMQVAYFVAIFTGVAWARDRRLMIIVAIGVLLLMFGWITYDFAVGSGVSEIMRRSGQPMPEQGLFSPAVAYVIYILVINLAYFGGAIVAGQVAWRSAKQRLRLTEQARTIEEQAAELQEQAVIEERLRIARELHDVVAHHVSVIGIQASGARRVLRRDPDTAEAALRTVETSARDAVTQMRGLLGALRSRTATSPSGEADRTPEPTLRDLPVLVDACRRDGLDVRFSVVGDGAEAFDAVSPQVGLSLYRTVQEALANVRRHSTAREATVVLRVERDDAGGYAEVEVLDHGRPRGATAGTGLGLLGIRERISTHGGSGEIGPRLTGGYRVRVRLPLSGPGSARVGAEAGGDRAGETISVAAAAGASGTPSRTERGSQ